MVTEDKIYELKDLLPEMFISKKDNKNEDYYINSLRSF